MKIRVIVPELKFTNDKLVFKVPFYYRFVRRLPTSYTSEYYLFPFNLIVRFKRWLKFNVKTRFKKTE
jgi:hypothetical protein